MYKVFTTIAIALPIAISIFAIGIAQDREQSKSFDIAQVEVVKAPNIDTEVMQVHYRAVANEVIEECVRINRLASNLRKNMDESTNTAPILNAVRKLNIRLNVVHNTELHEDTPNFDQVVRAYNHARAQVTNLRNEALKQCNQVQ